MREDDKVIEREKLRGKFCDFGAMITKGVRKMKSYVIDSLWGKFVISADTKAHLVKVAYVSAEGKEPHVPELTPDQAWEFTKVLGVLTATAEGGGE